MFKIEKKIPLPTRRTVISQYPWADMEVGDSFLVPDKKVKTVYVTVSKANKKYPPKHFISRAVKGGVRVWRDADKPGAETT